LEIVDLNFWKLKNNVEIDWDGCEFKKVVETNYWKCFFFQIFEELFSQNTNGTLPKFL